LSDNFEIFNLLDCNPIDSCHWLLETFQNLEYINIIILFHDKTELISWARLGTVFAVCQTE